MLKKSLSAIALAAISLPGFAANTLVEMQTSSGNIEIELFNDKAPISSKNFEDYVKSNFYTGTIFHRVIPGFMIQGGGFDAAMQEKPNAKAAIKNESYNGLQNKRGSLAMARTNQPDSAKAQFFINLVDNSFLDRSAMNAGYAVFGRVTKGMEIVDKIAKVPTRNYGMHQNVPVTAVQIKSVTIKTPSVNK
ncbi:peptidylprolyl isomerase [Acinetobacter bohemicus]|uniref:peptidylprolyl isomerase n=1 Tax=Acinetobacter TaxID=469 RepID=UPI00157D4090|nr:MULTISPECIES: peptidylprolyl isomerase [Acinetobacter]MCO8042857.1 peptidylprolyl isomerase [Acinetobacter sp. S4400-12]MCU7225272.1 peptidylprolyl isomerase [Acinetobacter bohemicus]MDM1782229.1 peptidyl-prolyl cis-trans isomerase [Acinetobacter indicus]QKQ68780.1 peptidyl-prolyl cis-trans isomerase [Acinetobacter sp. 10FS3-1]